MPAPDSILRALPYQDALANYLRTEEPESWAWFGSAKSRENYAESLRLDLLKQTYRLDPVAYPELFNAVAVAKQKLGLDVPVTLYQSQSSRELNAILYFIPGEAHIVFQGDVLSLLSPMEMRGLLGHELAHYVLWSSEEGRFQLADRICSAMAHDPRGEPSQAESARLLRLYTEIYADRGALLATGDQAPVITCLVKMQTGLTQVNAGSYVRQADEIFSRAKVKTDELSHPEAFIRARATALWAAQTEGVDDEVTRMIEGAAPLDKLDLLGQRRLTGWTRRWLRLFLAPAWFRTDAVQGHARMFFPDFEFAPEGHTDPELFKELRGAEKSVRDYFLYLLLDFSAVDPDLEDEPLRTGFGLAKEAGWAARLEVLAVKELKLKKREAQELRGIAGPETTAEPGEEPPLLDPKP